MRLCSTIIHLYRLLDVLCQNYNSCVTGKKPETFLKSPNNMSTTKITLSTKVCAYYLQPMI